LSVRAIAVDTTGSAYITGSTLDGYEFPGTTGVFDNDPAGEVFVTKLTPDGSAALADRDELERAFRRLPVDQRAVFVLHHYLGLPLVEIAELLEIPAGTARSRLHYATRALRDGLTADGELDLNGGRLA
jgi:RNA polymerase sigma-70 factor (ECF subfamily)